MDNMMTYSFCDSFLERLHRYLKEHYIDAGQDLSRVALVFGGKRPPLFVKRRLAQELQTNFLPPRFFTIDEFVQNIITQKEDFQVPQDLDSCYMLYQLTKTHCPHILKGREGFAQFLPWTREILAFMDQLDLEHIENHALKNIEANAHIGYDVPKDINQLLESIITLREVYHQKCQENKTYTRGYQYLRASELIHQVQFDEFDEIIFCNFFYFNQSEELIVKHLYEQGRATLLFQGDQRKWPVLTRIAERFQYDLLEGDAPETPQFQLQLYEAFDGHSQVAQVREILKNVDRLEDTVIVLPNPDQIVPLLSEIAPLVDEFNISMGYPLKRSSLYSLCEFMFDAQLSRKDQRYYTRDYLKVLQHPFVKNLKIQGEASATRILVHKLEEILTGKERASISGSSFIDLKELELSDELFDLTSEVLTRMKVQCSKQDLRLILQNIHDVFFHGWEQVQDFQMFAQTLQIFLDTLVHKSFMDQYPLNINIAHKMYELKDELSQADFQNETFLLEDLFRIFDHRISREIVAFIGSPLKGLQILGLFETRSLNFKNVIVLDVNEGALPRLNIYEPLIPREVMISLNLDRLELEEEIQRYQFMRLISSAEHVHLVYQESRDKEKSRFVQELLWEHEKQKIPRDRISASQASFAVAGDSSEQLITKTPEIVSFLKNFTFSASSINTYLRDPIEFYLNYVLGLRDAEDLLDEPESRHVGTFLHELLEDLFQPYIGKKPMFGAKFHDHALELFETKFDQTFMRTMKSDAFLLKRVLAERFTRFLKNEEENPERAIQEILYLENRFTDTLKLPVGDVKFNFIMDRIDRLADGSILMIDYKSGSMDQMPKDANFVDQMELTRDNIMDHIKSFQVPLYFYYLDQHFPDEQVNAALYNLRTLKITKFLSHQPEGDRSAIHQPYLNALNFVLEEIFNPEINFISPT